LRIAFVLLAAALLLPLALLLRSVDSRLEAQRRLRHELVAERIFDEMEGELTALLAREDARPSDAYVGSSTRVENWAPFVVGYFTRDERGVQILAKPQLAPERLHRLEAALKATGAARTDGQADTASAPAAAPSRADNAREMLEQRRQQSEASEAANRAAELMPSDAHFEVEPIKAAGRVKAGGTASSAPGAAQRVQPVPEAILKQLNRAADVREREQTRPTAKSKKLSHDDNDPLSGLE
jgi:hypothetical protein